MRTSTIDTWLRDISVRVSLKFVSPLIIILSLWVPAKAFANVPSDANLFIITVDATTADATPVGSYQLPISNSNYQLYWEEIGNEGANNSGGAVQVTTAYHTINFGGSGVYRIGIDPVNVLSGTNDFDHFAVNNIGDRLKLTGVSQWGTVPWLTMNNAFHGTPNLSDFSATDIPDFSLVTDMSGMYLNAPLAEPDVSGWDTSSVTTMNSMFVGSASSSLDVAAWNTSSVTDMTGMFALASELNPDVTAWDTSSLVEMASMFENAAAFDRDISGFDISNVTNISNVLVGSGFSQTHYDSFLISLDSQALQPGLNFNAGSRTYCLGEGARFDLIVSDGWTVLDGGKDCTEVNLLLVLEDSASTGGANNADGVAISRTRLSAINGLININAGSESDYQAAIAAETGFSNPPTVSEVQTIIDAVNSAKLFVITVDATIVDATPVGQYQIPSSNTNYQLQWEEVGNEVSNNSGGYLSVTGANHVVDFGAAGIYRIFIDPVGAATGINDFNHFVVNNSGDKLKLIDVTQWGSTVWSTMENAFKGAARLLGPSASDTPNFSNVTSMSDMFYDAVVATPNTSNWDTSSVTTISGMFIQAASANPDTSNWNTSLVTNMSHVFYGAGLANPDVSNWDTSLVTKMNMTFADATSANPDVSSWDTASVLDMRKMFQNAISANPDTSSWDTSAVAAIQKMFQGALVANPDISHWDTSLMHSFESMFENSNFSGDLGTFSIESLTNGLSMLDGVTLSESNYDSLLVGWGAQTAQNGVVFSGGNSAYCEGEDARNVLINTYGWVISDGGKNCTNTNLALVLEDSASTGGANNGNGASITVAQLLDIDGLIDIYAGNEIAYQTAIASVTDFSNPPTLEQVQAVINTVNSDAILAEVLEDSSSTQGANNNNAVSVTVAQLARLDGINSVNTLIEILYQEAIATEQHFSDPPTVAEVQQVIDRVNESEPSLAEVLEDSSSIGGNNDVNGTAVTLAQLASIHGIDRLLAEYESNYQQAIALEINFSNPPTVAQVQVLIDAVNSDTVLANVLAQSNSEGGQNVEQGSGNLPLITAEQLSQINGLLFIDPNHIRLYREGIAAETDFSNPPTVSELQNLVSAVNAMVETSESAIALVQAESSSLGGNAGGGISVEQLSSILGLVGVNPDNEAAYQSAIAREEGFSAPPSLAQLQALVDENNDADGDGISDAVEQGRDTDNDGISDNLDEDSDNDLISDLLEGVVDTDSDGIPDFRDLDSDNDGILDIIERLSNSRAAGTDDQNRDGQTVAGAMQSDEASVLHSELIDTDEDGVPDFHDLDSDNDGVLDVSEAGFIDANLDGHVDAAEDLFFDQLASAELRNDDGAVSALDSVPPDTDGDTIADYRDLDSDNDGLTDIVESHSRAFDLDGDGRWDDFIDNNGDGVSESFQVNPSAALDTDEDGYPNLIDLDSDADGLSDLLESGGVDSDLDGTVDNLQDNDLDGVDDGITFLPVVAVDTDNDGVPDYQDSDSDNDGVSDLTESGGLDADGDSKADRLTLIVELPDSDGDGVPNHLQSESGNLVIPNTGAAVGEVVVVGRGSLAGCSINTVNSSERIDPVIPALGVVALSWLLLRRRSVVNTLEIRAPIRR